MHQLRLRTLFLLVAAIACFLAWRYWNPEREIVASVLNAGGAVYLKCQDPKIATPGIVSQMILYDMVNFRPSQIDCSRDIPRNTAVNFLFGSKANQRVSAIKIDISDATPELMRRISTLEYLEILYIQMPGTYVSPDSPDAKRFDQIRTEFGDRVYPTLHPRYSPSQIHDNAG